MLPKSVADFATARQLFFPPNYDVQAQPIPLEMVDAEIIPDLQAEAARNPEMAAALQKALREGQHGVASGIVAQAVARGELRQGLAEGDEELALDLMSGPLYWRAVVVRGELPKGYLGALATATTAALKAL